MQRRLPTRCLKAGFSVRDSARALIKRFPIVGSFGSDVEARGVARQIAVQISANPYVTKLERGCDAATHLHSRAIGERWYRGFFGLFLLRFLCDRLRCLWMLDLACTPRK